MPVPVGIKADAAGHGFVPGKILHAVAAAVLHRDHVAEFPQLAVNLHARIHRPQVRHGMEDQRIINGIAGEVFLAERHFDPPGAHVELLVTPP